MHESAFFVQQHMVRGDNDTNAPPSAYLKAQQLETSPDMNIRVMRLSLRDASIINLYIFVGGNI